MVTAAGTISIYGDCSTSLQLACCNTQSRASFAGFTTGTTTGAATGRWHMHALCAAQFTGSHMCHAAEFLRAGSATTVPTGGAWLDPSTVSGTAAANSGVPESARYIGSNVCSSWTSTGGGDYGTRVTESGSIDSFGDCSQSLAIACCN
jgi:hypothetical protein